MQSGNRPEKNAGNGSHGKTADGFRTCGYGMGTAQDNAPGERDAESFQKGSEAMTGAEVDAIKEAADARAWEELNEEDPRVKAAIDLLTKAAHALQQAQDFLWEASQQVENSPETYRIGALEQAAQELEFDVRAQIRRF